MPWLNIGTRKEGRRVTEGRSWEEAERVKEIPCMPLAPFEGNLSKVLLRVCLDVGGWDWNYTFSEQLLTQPSSSQRKHCQ